MKIVISMFLGAIIGYVTNYIAIKMLFRPHNEIKIYGLKVPFTPGIIPKERKRIAKNIGQTIEQHLLTHEVIIKALSSDRFKVEIKRWLKEKINITSKSENELGIYFNNYLGEFYGQLYNKIKKIIIERIIYILTDENIRKQIINFALENIEKINIKDITNVILNNDVEKIKKLINEIVLIQDLKQRKLKDFISNEMYNNLNNTIINKKDDIAEFIKIKIKSPLVRAKIARLLYNILQQNVGKFISMLISPEFLAQRALTSIEDYLEKKESRNDIALLVINILDNILEIKIDEIIKSLSYNDQSIIIDELANKIFSFVSHDENIEKLENIIRNNINENREKINSVLSDSINELLRSPKFIEMLSSFMDKIIASLMNVKLNRLFIYVDMEGLDKLIDIIIENINDFMKENASYFIDLLDISTIVEDRINSLDVEYAEKIILDVANKELKAITWFGALLGAIMGIFNPLLEMLIK